MYDINWRPSWADKSTDYLAYAEVYKDSIEFLIKELKNMGNHSYQPIPILFLLRHYIEIQLTGLVMFASSFSLEIHKGIDKFLEDNRKTHSLLKIFSKLKECEYCLKFPKDFTEFLTNLEKYDKVSDRFRYPENRAGENYLKIEKFNRKFLNIINNANSLQKYAKVIIENLEGLETYFDVVKEGKEEEARINMEYSNSV